MHASPPFLWQLPPWTVQGSASDQIPRPRIWEITWFTVQEGFLGLGSLDPIKAPLTKCEENTRIVWDIKQHYLAKESSFLNRITLSSHCIKCTHVISAQQCPMWTSSWFPFVPPFSSLSTPDLFPAVSPSVWNVLPQLFMRLSLSDPLKICSTGTSLERSYVPSLSCLCPIILHLDILYFLCVCFLISYLPHLIEYFTWAGLFSDVGSV